MADVLSDHVDHVHAPALADVPLQIYGRYTRVEILAAVGEGDTAKSPQWREGVYDAKRIGSDLLAFTLDKMSLRPQRDTATTPSPETSCIGSQSVTRAASPTGRRYRDHESMGRSILLFARTRQDDRAFWFLGPASYVSHEGSGRWRAPGSCRLRCPVICSPSSQRPMASFIFELLKSDDLVRCVRRDESLDLVLGEFKIHGGDGVVHMVGLGGTDDGGVGGGVRHDPGQRDLRA